MGNLGKLIALILCLFTISFSSKQENWFDGSKVRVLVTFPNSDSVVLERKKEIAERVYEISLTLVCRNLYSGRVGWLTYQKMSSDDFFKDVIEVSGE